MVFGFQSKTLVGSVSLAPQLTTDDWQKSDSKKITNLVTLSL